MRILKQTSQFKRDLKKIQNNPKKVERLEKVLFQLRETSELSSQYKPHSLKGRYKGYMECHIEDDFLLIWVDEVENIIKLVRLGTHSELFG